MVVPVNGGAGPRIVRESPDRQHHDTMNGDDIHFLALIDYYCVTQYLT